MSALEDAFRCFMDSDIEVLVVEYTILLRDGRNLVLKHDYRNAFELD